MVSYQSNGVPVPFALYYHVIQGKVEFTPPPRKPSLDTTLDYQFHSQPLTYTTQAAVRMGRKADRKQAPPRIMPGSDLHKAKTGRKDKGKKKASTQSTSDRFAIKASKGPKKSQEKRQRQLTMRKAAKEDQEEDEDSDLEDALRQGELSEDEDEEETVKVKSIKGKSKGDDGRDLRTGPVKELVFSDSEGDEDLGDDDEQVPAGLHQFDLDEAPEMSDEEDMDDEFDLEEDDEDEEMGDEIDSAFASSDDGEGAQGLDVDMDGEMEGDSEDGDIQTNLEDDLTNEGFTLPAVDGEEEEYEQGTSLRDVETRMRWLVGVCVGKDERSSEGIPGRYVLGRSYTRLRNVAYITLDRVPTTCSNWNMILLPISDTTTSLSTSSCDSSLWTKLSRSLKPTNPHDP